MSERTVIETWSGEGYGVRVKADGRLTTEATEAPVSVVRSVVTVQTTSGTLAAARPGRRGVRLLVLGANVVYVRFEAVAATNQDWAVAAGAQLVMDPFPYEGEIRAIAVGGSSNVLVLESATVES